MSTLSSLGHALQNALETIYFNSPLQLTRLSFSTVLALPMFLSDSEHPEIRLVALFLSSIVLSAFALTYPLTAEEKSANLSAPALGSLSKFLIPTSSIWPNVYIDVARSAEQPPKGNTLLLKLETIFRDLRQGIVELRDPSSDLPQLVKGQLRLDGWNFKVDLSFKDKAKIWKWVLSEELSLLRDEGFPKLCTFADEAQISLADRMVLKHYCSLFFDTDEDIMIWPLLDVIPRAFFQQFIRSTQESLAAKHVTGKTSVFAFTTSETGLSMFDEAFVYAALPFSRVFSKSLKGPNGTPQRKAKSSASLFTRLPDILSLLASGPNALRVLSLSNASASYAAALDRHANALEYDDAARRECIKAMGVQRWREERLYSRWESALLRAGILTRWVVLLEAKD